jgi:hypothetical protein
VGCRFEATKQGATEGGHETGQYNSEVDLPQAGVRHGRQSHDLKEFAQHCPFLNQEF